jgi:hypothetical protein
VCAAMGSAPSCAPRTVVIQHGLESGGAAASGTKPSPPPLPEYWEDARFLGAVAPRTFCKYRHCVSKFEALVEPLPDVLGLKPRSRPVAPVEVRAQTTKEEGGSLPRRLFMDVVVLPLVVEKKGGNVPPQPLMEPPKPAVTTLPGMPDLTRPEPPRPKPPTPPAVSQSRGVTPRTSPFVTPRFEGPPAPPPRGATPRTTPVDTPRFEGQAGLSMALQSNTVSQALLQRGAEATTCGECRFQMYAARKTSDYGTPLTVA